MALTKVKYPDSDKLILGTGSDLEIFHDASNSYIKDTGTGDLNIAGSIVRLQSSGGETLARGVEDGAFELYHNNIKTFETNANGITVLATEGGDAYVNLYADEGDDNDDIWRIVSSSAGNFHIQNASSGAFENNIVADGNGGVELYYDNSKKFDTFSGGCKIYGDLHLPTDNEWAYFGASDDLKVGHDGNNSYVQDDGTGFLGIQGSEVRIRNNSGHPQIVCSDDVVELWYDNSKKFETLAGGAKVNSSASATAEFGIQAASGQNAELWLLSDAGNQYGDKVRLLQDDGVLSTQFNTAADTWENAIICTANGAVDLYHNNSKTFATNAEGVRVFSLQTAAYPLSIENTNGNNIFRVYESSNGDGNHGLVYMFTNGGDNNVKLNTNGASWIVNDFYVATTSGTIGTSNFGHNLASNGWFGNARNVNGNSGICQQYGNAGEHRVLGDGDVQNTNNSYGQISDQTLKQDIVDAASQWNDIKQVKVRKFRFKDRPTAPLQIGVVAQELETISPGLVKEVYENGEDGNKVKMVKYSVLYMKAIKALQEAMAKIETLETKVAALETA